MSTALDSIHMAHALRLAELGLCTTAPNPRVGCVIARDAKVIGTGWHRRVGEAHAEVFALAEAAAAARGATAYVTLEPCGLHGRTPPCADALIAAGIARVVIASEDAFQRDGGAIARLRAAGIVVESGLMRDAARELNRGFFSRVERGRPWLRIKLAMSLDGRTALADGSSKWITGEAARADVQRWRARSSALLTGSGTVLADDPALTVRLQPLSQREKRKGEGSDEMPHRIPGDIPAGNGSISATQGHEAAVAVSPLRVVLDHDLRTPAQAKVFDGSAPTLFLHAHGARPPDSGTHAGVEFAAVESRQGRLDLDAVLRDLARRDCNEVQVEAGATLCGALFAAGLVDELLLYVAPMLLGDSARPLLALPPLADMAARWRLRAVDQRAVGSDWRLLLRPE